MADSTYTPKMTDLRVAYRFAHAEMLPDPDSKPFDQAEQDEADAAFDRLITQIKVEALRDAADAVTSRVTQVQAGATPNPIDWQTGALCTRDLVRIRADSIEREGRA